MSLPGVTQHLKPPTNNPAGYLLKSTGGARLLDQFSFCSLGIIYFSQRKGDLFEGWLVLGFCFFFEAGLVP